MFFSPLDFKVAIFWVAIKFAGFYSRLFGHFSVSGNVCLNYVDETLKRFFPFQRVSFWKVAWKTQIDASIFQEVTFLLSFPRVDFFFYKIVSNQTVFQKKKKNTPQTGVQTFFLWLKSFFQVQKVISLKFSPEIVFELHIKSLHRKLS